MNRLKVGRAGAPARDGARLTQPMPAPQSMMASNAVLKEHELGEQIGSAGPGLLWRVHDAKQRSRGARAAVFVVHKKDVTADKSLPAPQREKLLEVLRAGCVRSGAGRAVGEGG